MIGASKKLLQGTAGNAGGGPLDVDDVFSTYLYEGDGATTHTITNGIDLDGEGGLVWVKRRDASGDHNLTDTERGTGNVLNTAGTGGSANFLTYNVKAFNSNGFSVGSHPTQSASINYSGDDYASWTFRKAPKFFDVVTYTGNGVGFPGPQISHNLQARPGWIVIKRTDSTGTWDVAAMHGPGHQFGDNIYYRFNTGTPFGFDNNNASAGVAGLYPTYVSDTYFMPNLIGQNANVSGATYVAYLFAHNDGDGEFGPDGDQDIIKCGSFTPDGSENATIDLGFEPQWFLVKSATGSGSWLLYDNMRGMTASGSADYYLLPNSSSAEGTGSYIAVTPTGIDWSGTGGGNTFIYMAIRRGPLAPPESATEVFALGDQTATSGFPVDSVLSTYFETYANNHMLYDRLRATDGSRLLFTHSNAAENTSNPFSLSIASNTGVERNWGSGWNHKMFRRAPGFFDVVAYTGAGSNQTLKHNLTVKPELSIVKYRTGSYSISTYTSWGTNTLTDGTNNPTLFLNTDRDNLGNTNAYWQEATNTEIYVGGANNENSFTYIMYLFATLAGISKVGKYTGNGSSQTINCGFTSGARYVLIKRYDSAGDWYVWDTLRGIVAGNDPYMRLNITTGEVTSNDSIDPASSGFIVNQVSATNINVSGAKYAYYSVA